MGNKFYRHFGSHKCSTWFSVRNQGHTRMVYVCRLIHTWLDYFSLRSFTNVNSLDWLQNTFLCTISWHGVCYIKKQEHKKMRKFLINKNICHYYWLRKRIGKERAYRVACTIEKVILIFGRDQVGGTENGGL